MDYAPSMSQMVSRWESQSYENWMNEMATREYLGPNLSGNARQRRKVLRAYRFDQRVKGTGIR